MGRIRKGIRQFIIERLKAANTLAGDRIFASRGVSVGKAQMPCISVYTMSEPSKVSAESPREYERKLNVVIVAFARAEKVEEVENALDDFCDQIEDVIFEDETQGKRCADTILVDCNFEVDEDCDRPNGAATIVLECPYFDYLPKDSAQELPELKTIGLTVKKPGTRLILSESETEVPA